MPEPEKVFAHAVASFDPTSSSVLLWTHLDGATNADLVVARDPDLGDVVHRSSHETGPDQDHTVVVDVDGLDPATSYWYRFTSAGQSSPVGRTRTLPEGPVDRFRLGLVSCANYSAAPLGVYRVLAEREVDLVLHLGDYIYESESKGPRPHEPERTIVTVDDYRQRLGQIRRDPDLQALHLRHPMVAIWDDHDLADNAWSTGAKKHDPDEHGPWDDRVRAAAAARQEWLPMRLTDPDDLLVQWRSIPIGDLAELVLLDTRIAGRDQHAGDDGTSDRDDPDRSLLGDAQRSWLERRVLEAPQRWSLVASGVVVNQLELDWPRPLSWVNGLTPNGYAVLDGKVLHDDQWDGYTAERDRLARWMDDRARDGRRTVLLSGDVHSSWAFAGPCLPDDGDEVGVEITTPAVSSAAMGQAHYPGVARLIDRAVDEMDHVCWANVTRRGYTIVEVTPEQVHADWWFVQPYDQDPSAGQHLGASFVAEQRYWPPRLTAVEEPTADPVRPGLPAPLPDRPHDLRRLRTRRRLRLAAESVAVPALLVALAALLHRVRSRIV